MDDKSLKEMQSETLSNVLSQCALVMGESVVMRSIRLYLLTKGKDVCSYFPSGDEDDLCVYP